MGPFLTNRFGDRYLHEVNRSAFNEVGSDTLYQQRFEKGMFASDTLHVVIGTDSGLLLRYLQKRNLPEGSRYLFVELDKVINRLTAEGLLDVLPGNVAITTEESFWKNAEDFQITNYFYLESVKLWESVATIDGYLPDYRNISTRIQGLIKNKAFNLSSNISLRSFIAQQIENIPDNRIPGAFLKGMFKGKTAVILGGGPSLDELLPWVYEHRDQIAIFAVSRISRRLLEFGLTPHFVLSVDPQEHSSNISREMLLFPDDTIFIHNNHVASRLLALWKGRSIYLGLRFPWETPLNHLNILPWGPTVTNTALCAVTAMGFGQAILVGVDLCYSRNGMTHALGSYESEAGPKLDDTIVVKTNCGGTAETDPGYFNAIAQLAEQAAVAINNGCRVISPAKDAAQVPHVEFVPADTITIPEPCLFPNKIVADSMPEKDATERRDDMLHVLGELNSAIKKMGEIRALIVEALECNNRLLTPQDTKVDAPLKKRLAQIDQILNRDFSQWVPLLKQFGIRDFLKITKGDTVRKLSPLETQNSWRAYYDAYLKSTDEITALLNASIKRAQCRLEEDAPNPDFQKIFDQWSENKQAWRIFAFKHRRLDMASQIPAHLADRVKKWEADGWAWLKARLEGKKPVPARSLDAVLGKSLNLFLQRNVAGLERLISGLAQHPDQAHAQELQALANGYRFELNDKLDRALECYQVLISETFTPLTEEALRRIAVICLEQKNMEMAQLALECLSNASLSYKPKYADLLAALGRRQEAADLYTEYLEAVPSDVGVLMKLGKNYRTMGAEDAARTVFSMILEQDPNNMAAQTLLQEN
ncbi:6-hydroxymethylpterin diphosphokinase MptE-like protein [Geoalkalibacter halelectricus]|uniref:DUF115 domain-containing protein n=1 Tax=Geoalkalibacter halelectricus TaxID=2847045 RepID=A0ABY5ZV55_9BACT|nr:6-hydroxymethylpterin diphosphokinase MptE-like protein [Geoalkalibacter halelectricus]MDO3377983.1 DUF115 domain-containing protein [Geoalkalibacter halelectricus]UWZ81514.1 DUF115 domain-containing protein [Geoalkalibacter halelectricus]